MHSPVIHGSHVLNGSIEDLSSEDQAFGEALLRQVLNLKAVGKLDSLRMTKSLPGGGYVSAISMGGINKILYYLKASESAGVREEDIPTWRVPMLYSGRVVTVRYMPEEQDGPLLHVSALTQRRLREYATLPEGHPSRFISVRHAVPPGERVPEFGPDGQGRFNNTQYQMHRAGWYSGTMAQVVQAVSGYGRQGSTWYGGKRYLFTDMLVPDEVMREIRDEYRDEGWRYPDVMSCHWRIEDEKAETITEADWLFQPGCVGFPPSDGAIRFAYRWDSTDGVCFDSTGRPWLVNVSRKGIYGMPLPLVPATRTRAFRAWIESIGDAEILALLDRFGGMPSGEDWPVATNRELCEKAGIVIKLGEAGDFYANLAYSPALGWAFAEHGREGYNTCYSYDQGSGLQHGYGFKLAVTINGAGYSPWTPSVSPFYHATVRAYLNELFGWLGSTLSGQVIRYKVIRAGFEAVYDRARWANADRTVRMREEPQYWRDLEQGPIAQGTAKITKVSEGILFPTTGRARKQPQIKFPELVQRICMSHDFMPMDQGRDENPRCDTVMYGYYIGNALKVVKYFREPRNVRHEVQSDFEECMIVGQWEQIETYGEAQMQGAFYTSDFDERAQCGESVKTTKIAGQDRGMQPASDAAFGFQPWPFQNGTMSRSRFFSQDTTEDTVSTPRLQTAICIPFFERCAALHAYEYTDAGTSHYEGSALHSIPDPTSYGLWTFHWALRYIATVDPQYMTAQPYPEDCNIFWLEGEFTSNGGACSDFANQGAWRMPIEDVTGEVARSPGSTGDSSTGWQPTFFPKQSSTETAPTTEQKLSVSILPGGVDIGDKVDAMYFVNSPDEYGMTMYREAGKNYLGDTEYAVVSEGDGEELVHWGESEFIDKHTTIPCFIGVVDT